MNRATTLVLFVLVLGLGYAIHWQTQREEAMPQVVENLFPGVDVGRVNRIRLENVRRSTIVLLEKDDTGQWRMTDPHDSPADRGLLDQLLSIIQRNPAQEVPPGEREDLESSFAALAMLDVGEVLSDGTERTHRIEVGELDLDEFRVLIRRTDERGTRLLRTPRDVWNTLERPVTDFRSRRVFTMDPRRVVAVERFGQLVAGTDVRNLHLTAFRSGHSWRMSDPLQAQLDPLMMGMWVAGALSVRIDQFVDGGRLDLATFGLDAPEVSVSFVHQDGSRETVLLGRAIEGGNWYAKREDKREVWALEADARPHLVQDPRELLDHELVRMLRSDVRKVTLRDGPRELVLQRQLQLARGDEDGWLVALREEEGEALDFSVANLDKVVDVLAVLEAGELRYLPDLTLEQAFPDGLPTRSFFVEDVHGVRQGGRVGGPFSTDGGTPGVLFLREEDRVPSLVDARVADIFELEPLDLFSLEILALREVRMRSLVFAHDGGERTFKRDHDGRWGYPDAPFEATELHPILDPLLFLRAERHVPADEIEPLSDVVEVRAAISGLSGGVERVSVRIGTGPDGRVEAEMGGLRSVLADQELHAKLVEIADRE